MIIYAHTYPDSASSKADFDRFLGWSKEHVPHDASAFRTRLQDEDVFYVIVVDVSANEGTLAFQFTGTPVELDRQTSEAFARRRSSAVLTNALLGGEMPEHIHHAPGTEPHVVDGRWYFPGE